VLEVWWRTEDAPDGDEVEAWLLGRARTAAAAAPAPVLVVVGRSWGSRALAKLVLAGEAPDVLVWVTPLLPHAEVRRAVDAAAPRSLVIAGTADEMTPRNHLDRLRSLGATVAPVDGGDHGLGVGEAAASARALAEVLDALGAFLASALR
jgi:hypothetical protein